MCECVSWCVGVQYGTVCGRCYHLGSTSGARLDCTVSQSTFNLPGARSPPRKVDASARTSLSPLETRRGRGGEREGLGRRSGRTIHNGWQLVFSVLLHFASGTSGAHLSFALLELMWCANAGALDRVLA